MTKNNFLIKFRDQLLLILSKFGHFFKKVSNCEVRRADVANRPRKPPPNIKKTAEAFLINPETLAISPFLFKETQTLENQNLNPWPQQR